MDQFDAFKAVGEFWARAGQGILEAGARAGGPGLGWPGFPKADLAGLTEAQAALTQSWASAGDLSRTLMASLRGGEDAPDPTAGAVLARIFDPQAWLGGTAEFDAALNRMAEGPQLADLWQTEQRFGALFTAWTGLRQAQAAYQAMMLDAWTRAAGTFAREANAKAARGERFATAREMTQSWIETANAVLLEVQRSDPFLKAQRAVLKAGTDLRLVQQDLSAHTSAFYGQPTRAELDDVHKSLTELRREVRALRRKGRAAAKTAAKAGRTGDGTDPGGAHG